MDEVTLVNTYTVKWRAPTLSLMLRSMKELGPSDPSNAMDTDHNKISERTNISIVKFRDIPAPWAKHPSRGYKEIHVSTLNSYLKILSSRYTLKIEGGGVWKVRKSPGSLDSKDNFLLKSHTEHLYLSRSLSILSLLKVTNGLWMQRERDGLGICTTGIPKKKDLQQCLQIQSQCGHIYKENFAFSSELGRREQNV